METSAKPPEAIDASPTFQHFRKLPEELRRLIWEMAIPEPLAEVQLKILHTEQHYVHYDDVPKAFITRKLPTVFHVNHEARDEALFRTKFLYTLQGGASTQAAKLFMDPEKSALVLYTRPFEQIIVNLEDPPPLYDFSLESLKWHLPIQLYVKLRHVHLLLLPDGRRVWLGGKDWLDMLSKLTALQTLVVVFDGRSPCWYDLDCLRMLARILCGQYASLTGAPESRLVELRMVSRTAHCNHERNNLQERENILDMIATVDEAIERFKRNDKAYFHDPHAFPEYCTLCEPDGENASRNDASGDDSDSNDADGDDSDSDHANGDDSNGDDADADDTNGDDTDNDDTNTSDRNGDSNVADAKTTSREHVRNQDSGMLQ